MASELVNAQPKGKPFWLFRREAFDNAEKKIKELCIIPCEQDHLIAEIEFITASSHSKAIEILKMFIDRKIIELKDGKMVIKK